MAVLMKFAYRTWPGILRPFLRQPLLALTGTRLDIGGLMKDEGRRLTTQAGMDFMEPYLVLLGLTAARSNLENTREHYENLLRNTNDHDRRNWV